MFSTVRLADPDLMLLEVHRRFSYANDDAWAPSTADAVWFDPDGRWYRGQRTEPGPLAETRGQLPAEQIAELTELFPPFGHWIGIARPRTLPPGPG